MMDTHIRDNFLAVGPHLIVRKPSDESVVASVTQQADDHLILPVAANEVWHFKFSLVVVSTAAADFACSFTFPTGGDLRLSLFALNDAGTAVNQNWSSTTSPSATKNLATSATAAEYSTFPLEGLFVNAGTAGSLTLLWAQVVASGTTTMKANSTLWAVRLAEGVRWN